MSALLGYEVGGLLVGAAGVNLIRGLGLVATQTLTFLFTDIEGSTVMWQRPGNAGTVAGLEVRRAARTAAVTHER